MTTPRGSQSQALAKKKFLQGLETAIRIYAPAREMCRFNNESFNDNTYKPNVAAKIIGLAFLSAVATWEDFVEDVYLGYLCGYPAPSGYKPCLRAGPAQHKPHALTLAAGESNERDAERKLRWSDFKWVQSLSNIHFAPNNVFSEVSSMDVEWLYLARIIRNRVAHNSKKAKSQYKVALNRLMGNRPDAPLLRGFSPGKFLICETDTDKHLLPLMTEDHHWPDVFEGYISLWQRLADNLCPMQR